MEIGEVYQTNDGNLVMIVSNYNNQTEEIKAVYLEYAKGYPDNYGKGDIVGFHPDDLFGPVTIHINIVGNVFGGLV